MTERALDGLATDAVQKLWERIERGNQTEDLRGIVVRDLKCLGYKLFSNCSVALEYDFIDFPDTVFVIRQIECEDGDFSVDKLTSGRWSSCSFWDYRSDFVAVGLLTDSEVEEQEMVFKANEDSEREMEEAQLEARERLEYERLKLKFEGDSR